MRALAVPAAIVLALPASRAPAQDPPARAIELPADWAERDLEGRWVAYRRDRDAHRADEHLLKKWTELLAARRDFELLEWIAIFEGWREAGPALVAANAPQWPRVARWNLRAYDSHSFDNARKALIDLRPRLALGWFEKYPLARKGPARDVYQKLRAEHDPVDPGGKLPPLAAAQVLLPHLDAPPELARFGDRTRAEPGTRYVHQVLRALDGVLVWGGATELHVHKIERLTEHPIRDVRVRAFEVLTAIPAHLVPWRTMRARAAAPSAPDTDRSWAVMVASFSDHPESWLAVLAIAENPDHPGWSVAVERLGDIGHAFDAAVLENLAAELPSRSAPLHAAAHKARARSDPEELRGEAPRILTLLARAMWAEETGHARAEPLGHWTRALLGELWPEDELAEHLTALRKRTDLWPGSLTDTERTRLDRRWKAWTRRATAGG